MDITNLNDFVEDADQVAQNYPIDDSTLLSCWGDPDEDGCGSQSSAAVAAASNPPSDGGEPPSSSESAAEKLSASRNAGQKQAPPPSATASRSVGGGVNAGGLLYNPLNARPTTGDAGGGGKNGRNKTTGGGSSRGDKVDGDASCSVSGTDAGASQKRGQRQQSPIPRSSLGGVGGVPMVAVAGAGSQPQAPTRLKSDNPPSSHQLAAPATQQQQIQLQQQLNSFAGSFNFLAPPPPGSVGAPIVVPANQTGMAAGGGVQLVQPLGDGGAAHANVIANSNGDLAAWKWSSNASGQVSTSVIQAPQPLAPPPTPPPPHQQFPLPPFQPAEAGSWASNGSWGGGGGGGVGNASVPYAGAIADDRRHVPQHLVSHQQPQSEAAGMAQHPPRIQEQQTTASINVDHKKAPAEHQPSEEQPGQDTATSQAPGGAASSAGTPSSFNLFDAPCELRLNFLKSQRSHASATSGSESADATNRPKDPSRPQEQQVGVAQSAQPSSSSTRPQGGGAGCATGVSDGSTTGPGLNSSTNSLVTTGAPGSAASNSTSGRAPTQEQHQTRIFGMNVGSLAPPAALHPATNDLTQQQQQPQATPMPVPQGSVNSSTEIPIAHAQASKQGWCVYINGQQYMLSQPPVELRQHPQQTQQAVGVVPLPPGTVASGGATASPVMVVHGLPQQQGSLPISVASTAQPLPPLVASSAATTGIAPPSSVVAGAATPPQALDHKAQMLKERNEREQRRAQKITILIDNLRTSMQEGGWKVELKSKYHTLSQSRHYLRHLKRVTREKEEQVRKAREDLERLKLRREREKDLCSANMYASEGGGSDPESVLSSLTADSVVKSSRGGDTTMGEGSSRSQGGCESGSNDNMQSSRSGKSARSHDHNSCGTDVGDAACIQKKEQHSVSGKDLPSSVSKKPKQESKGNHGSLGEDGDNGDRSIQGKNGCHEDAEEKGEDVSSRTSPSQGNIDEGEKKLAEGRHCTSTHHDGPGSGKTPASHQPHSIRISKQNSTVSDMTNKDETDSNVAICEPILKGGTLCSEASASDGGASPEQHHRPNRGHSRRRQHKEFAAHMLKKVAIVKVPIKRKRVGSSSKGSGPSKRSKSSLDQDFELNYKEVFLTSNVPQLIATPTGRIVTWNKFFLQVTGLSADELKNLTIFSIVQADKLSRLFEIVATALRASNNNKESPASKPASKSLEKNDCVSSNTSNRCMTTSSGSSTGCASGDGSGDGSTDKEHMTGGGTTASSSTDDSTCLKKSNAFRVTDCRRKDKKVRQIDYATVTLPCVKFARDLGGAAVNVDSDPHEAVEQQRGSCSPKPMYMTVTLMDDKDPRKRCFHCALTDNPGTNGALGSITPNLLAQIFSSEPCPSVIAEDGDGRVT